MKPNGCPREHHMLYAIYSQWPDEELRVRQPMSVHILIPIVRENQRLYLD